MSHNLAEFVSTIPEVPFVGHRIMHPAGLAAFIPLYARVFVEPGF